MGSYALGSKGVGTFPAVEVTGAEGVQVASHKKKLITSLRMLNLRVNEVLGGGFFSEEGSVG